MLEFAAGVAGTPGAGHAQLLQTGGTFQGVQNASTGVLTEDISSQLSGTVNSQTPAVRRFFQVGRTTANGQTVTLVIPMVAGHSLMTQIEVLGRLVVVGASGSIGNTYGLDCVEYAENQGGAVSFNQVRASVATDTSQAGNSFTVDTATANEMKAVISQGGAPNVGATVDWIIVATVWDN